MHRMKTELLSPKRLAFEYKTLTAMLHIYCQAHHPGYSTGGLCPECENLLVYAAKRLAKCPFKQRKPTCGNCRIHCYKKDMRRQVQEVMRFSGPRMVYRHPVMALKHMIDSWRKTPEQGNKFTS